MRAFPCTGGQCSSQPSWRACPSPLCRRRRPAASRGARARAPSRCRRSPGRRRRARADASGPARGRGRGGSATPTGGTGATTMGARCTSLRGRHGERHLPRAERRRPHADRRRPRDRLAAARRRRTRGSSGRSAAPAAARLDRAATRRRAPSCAGKLRVSPGRWTPDAGLVRLPVDALQRQRPRLHADRRATADSYTVGADDLGHVLAAIVQARSGTTTQAVFSLATARRRDRPAGARNRPGEARPSAGRPATVASARRS